ncbi:adenosine receptor A2a-like [Diadema setosum]|uniref:adenosine receptor A2a-like n=1 Tax=Diadema setosum TaxID=31175 RepID=UPI003B3BC4DC
MSDMVIDVIIGLIVLTNAVGNVLVIFTYQRESVLRVPANTYIVSLAFADLFYVVLAPVCLALSNTLDISQHGNCMWTLTLLMVNFPVSIFHLLLIAMDRYTAVTQPLRYFVIMSELRVNVYLGLAWGMGLLIGLLPQFGWYNMLDAPIKSCSYLLLLPQEYFILLFTVCFAFPLIILVFLYLVMFREARRQTRRVAQLEVAVLFKNGVRRKPRLMRDIKATVTVGLILGSFIFCFLPTCIVYFVYISNAHLIELQVFLLLSRVCNITLALSTAVNPFIYAYKSQRFRQRASTLVHRSYNLSKKMFGCQS